MLKITGKEKRFLVFIAVTIVLLSGLEYLIKCYRLGLAADLEAEMYDLEAKLNTETQSEQENTSQSEVGDSQLKIVTSIKETADDTACDLELFVQEELNQETDLNAESNPVKTDSNLEHKQPVLKINLNTATYNELIKIPGIGKVLAERILKYREQKQRFLSLDELKEVKGIGAKTLEKIKPYLTL